MVYSFNLVQARSARIDLKNSMKHPEILMFPMVNTRSFPQESPISSQAVMRV